MQGCGFRESNGPRVLALGSGDPAWINLKAAGWLVAIHRQPQHVFTGVLSAESVRREDHDMMFDDATRDLPAFRNVSIRMRHFFAFHNWTTNCPSRRGGTSDMYD